MSALSDWTTLLPDAAAMRAVDRWAIEQQGVPGLQLMERAGEGVVRVLERLAPDAPVTVLCGKGNNGGDGLVVARLLREQGRHVAVVCCAPPEELSGDARANLDRLPDPPVLRLDGTPWEGPVAYAGAAEPRDLFPRGVVAVDALLGTGFKGEPHGVIAEAIEALGRSGAPTVSVDVPSGVDASTGQAGGAVVSAIATATFHAPKPGLWINPGKAHAGEIVVVDIGIPRGAPLDAEIGLIDAELLAAVPRRSALSTKFDSGQVLVAGGSAGLTGAPQMAARGAMRAGAGYVTVCVPASLQPVLAAAGIPEMMTRAQSEDGAGSFAPGAASEVLQALRPGGAIALGPGLGRSEGAQEFARALAAGAQAPLLIDADGLNAHAGRLGGLASRSHPTVLTPHAGELARLLEVSSAEVSARRLEHARAAAAASGAVVVLKGDDTLVAAPGGEVAVSRGASPALATAGTGDVLSGVVAALLAQGLGALQAAAAGVWLHAQAGRIAAERVGWVQSVIASDVIEALPAAAAAGAREGGRHV